MLYTSKLTPKLVSLDYTWEYWIGDNILEPVNPVPFYPGPNGDYTIEDDTVGTHLFLRFKDRIESPGITAVTIPISHLY